MPEVDVALELFLRWLNEAHARRFRVADRANGGATAAEDDLRIAIEVRPLLPFENAPWDAARRRIEETLSEALPGAYVLWVPAGADMPSGEPDLSQFLDLVRQAAVRLGPHERAHVPIPIRLYLRKNSGEGGVISVSGGLNAYWARFTERVRGTYDLDSTQLHRLPESEEHLEALIDKIVDVAARLSPRQAAEIETIDAWTVQGLPEGGRGFTLSKPGFTMVGVPPREAAEHGLLVRRNFRRLLAEAIPRLRAADARLRGLVVIGYWPRAEQEGATTALRGYDPALYSGADFICLAVDGLIKPIIEPPAAALPWNRS